MLNNDDILKENNEAPTQIDLKRKKQIMRLIFSFAILLIVGVSVSYLLPYLKTLAKFHFISTPTIILSVFVMPFFWLLCGWTLIDVFDVLGIVEIKHSKLSKWIFKSALVLVLLYFVIILPYIIESTYVMIQQFKYMKNPEAFHNGFSFSSQLPMLLNKIEYRMISINNKSVIFTVLGLILRICKSKKQNR